MGTIMGSYMPPNGHQTPWDGIPGDDPLWTPYMVPKGVLKRDPKRVISQTAASTLSMTLSNPEHPQIPGYDPFWTIFGPPQMTHFGGLGVLHAHDGLWTHLMGNWGHIPSPYGDGMGPLWGGAQTPPKGGLRGYPIWDPLGVPGGSKRCRNPTSEGSAPGPKRAMSGFDNPWETGSTTLGCPFWCPYLDPKCIVSLDQTLSKRVQIW